MSIKSKMSKESRTIMTEMIMPNDTNPLGNLMGGNLMRWMDIAGGICAARHAEAHVVTASVDNVSFKHPIHKGNVITITANVTRAFNTSMEVYIEVFAAEVTGANSIKSNHAYMTFVALDEVSKKPLKIPALTPETESELKLYDGAQRRRELRLVLAGRMHPDDATELKSIFN